MSLQAWIGLYLYQVNAEYEILHVMSTRRVIKLLSVYSSYTECQCKRESWICLCLYQINAECEILHVLCTHRMRLCKNWVNAEWGYTVQLHGIVENTQYVNKIQIVNWVTVKTLSTLFTSWHTLSTSVRAFPSTNGQGNTVCITLENQKQFTVVSDTPAPIDTCLVVCPHWKTPDRCSNPRRRSYCSPLTDVLLLQP